MITRVGFCGPSAALPAFAPKEASTAAAAAFWCALTGSSSMTGGGDVEELE